MDLLVISEALITYSQREEFDNWILQNETDLSNFFYKNNGKLFDEIGFYDFFHRDFLESVVYKDYHLLRNSSEAFTFFLRLISSASEKLALYGNDAPAKRIINDLPDSAIKFRLEAIILFTLVENIKTSYVSSFPDILELLDKSRVNFDDDNIRPILDVLIGFYTKAKSSLEKKNLGYIVETLKSLFKDQDLILMYPFLDNQVIEDLLDGKELFTMSLNDIERECFTPSMMITNLFKEINIKYFSHPKIDHSRNNLWGFNKKYILDNILGRGRGDYTVNTGEITTEDKVTLYCFYNLKKHFFTSYGVFEYVVKSFEDFFNNKDYIPTFIDLGCGPMTSGLALGDLIYNKTGKAILFTYIGIDISQSMLDRAMEFQKTPIFSIDSEFYYYTNWGKLEFKILYNKGIHHPIIINASYLFASNSLDIKSLANTIGVISGQFKNVYFIFQNSTLNERNLKYVEFKSYLSFTPLISETEVLRYKASPSSLETEENVYYEILKL